VGLLMQACALMGLLHSQGPGFGSLLWTVMLTFNAMTVAFVLTWKPRWLAPLARQLQHDSSSK
jgi:hypothetical protein